MAEKKTVKKSAPKAEAPKTIADFRSEVMQKQADLLDAKRSNAAGELVNPRAITALRKDIARLQTAIRLAEINDQKENK